MLHVKNIWVSLGWKLLKIAFETFPRLLIAIKINISTFIWDGVVSQCSSCGMCRPTIWCSWKSRKENCLTIENCDLAITLHFMSQNELNVLLIVHSYFLKPSTIVYDYLITVLCHVSCTWAREKKFEFNMPINWI